MGKEIVFAILLLSLGGLLLHADVYSVYADTKICMNYGQNDADLNKQRNTSANPLLKQEALNAFNDIGQQGDWKTFEKKFMEKCIAAYNEGYDFVLFTDKIERASQSSLLKEIGSEQVYSDGVKDGNSNVDCKQDGINDAKQSKSKTRVSPADVEFRAIQSFEKRYQENTLQNIGMYEIFLDGYTKGCQDVYKSGYGSTSSHSSGNILDDTFGQIKESVEKEITGVIKENADQMADELGKEIANQIVPDIDLGGCLIATATYGTELAPQVQLLREIRDHTLQSTMSGITFMSGFNQLYYSFSPTIADWERENPVFKEAVKIFITPILSTLSIMTLAEEGTEVEVLGLGISVIVLNLGMYIAAPAIVIWQVRKRI